VLVALLAGALYAAALYDLFHELTVLGAGATWLLFALALASVLLYTAKKGSKNWALLALLLGACGAFGIRALAGETSPFRPSGSARDLRDREALSSATSAKERFRELAEETRSAAESAAREPSIEESRVHGPRGAEASTVAPERSPGDLPLRPLAPPSRLGR
jgi:hypothetical protein